MTHWLKNPLVPPLGRACLRLLRFTCVVGVVVGCATYDGTHLPPGVGSDDQGGSAGLSSSGGPADSGAPNHGGAGRAGGANVAGESAIEGGHGGDAGDTSDSGSGGRAGGGGSSSGAGGTLNMAGAGGRAGAGGSGGSGGRAGAGGSGTAGASAGAAGSGGSTAGGGAGGSTSAGAGGAPMDVLLSQGKAVAADSTETGNVATFGNDGSSTTRWCAANNGLNHYWQVDLGASRTLVRVDIVWEKSANYKFKIEGSADNNTWAMLVDQQTTTASASAQSYDLGTSPKARWVRITVTGLPNSTTWASFYELQVFGH